MTDVLTTDRYMQVPIYVPFIAFPGTVSILLPPVHPSVVRPLDSCALVLQLRVRTYCKSIRSLFVSISMPHNVEAFSGLPPFHWDNGSSFEGEAANEAVNIKA